VSVPDFLISSVVPAGTQVTDPEHGGAITIGAAGTVPGVTPGASNSNSSSAQIYILDWTKTSLGSLPPGYGLMDPDTAPGFLTPGIVLGHEIGHVQYAWGKGSPAALNTGQNAVMRENDVRRWMDPNAPVRARDVGIP